MKNIAFLLLALLGCPAHAEIFKCVLASGITAYQATPCQSAVKQEAVDIKNIPPEKEAEAAQKLKNWEIGFAEREAARASAEKELQEKKDKEEQEALEAKLKAEALERQSTRDMRIYYQGYGYQGVRPAPPDQNDQAEQPQ